MDDRIARKTQETLGKIIKKPPLTEKLLRKPPFRFLHDIITSVIKTTGFMKGLYTDQEMQSDNVKDKDSKIAFLQKAIDLVALATNQQLAVKTSKIVAGHDAEKTNEFLQILAAAISKKTSNDELVQQVLSGNKLVSPDKPIKKETRETSSDRKKDKKECDGSGREKGESRDGVRDRLDSSEQKEIQKEEKENNREEKDAERRKKRDERRTEQHQKLERQPSKENGHLAPNGGQNNDKDDGDSRAVRIPRPSSAKGSRRRHKEDDDERFKTESKDGDEQNKMKTDDGNVADARGGRDASQVDTSRKSARPSSARPAPPKPKKQIETELEPDIRMMGSGFRLNQVIVDNGGRHSEDEDDNFVVDDNPTVPEASHVFMEHTQDAEGEHGGLVKKILETKKELEGGNEPSRKVDVEKPVMSDVSRRKEREMVERDVDRLRASIQTLTRSANPLGKVLDYVQEDLDSMQKEMEKWRKENKEHAQALKREQSVTESSVEPLRGQLSELDQAVSDQLVQIAAVKANIARNESKISHMLSSVTKS